MKGVFADVAKGHVIMICDDHKCTSRNFPEHSSSHSITKQEPCPVLDWLELEFCLRGFMNRSDDDAFLAYQTSFFDKPAPKKCMQPCPVPDSRPITCICHLTGGTKHFFRHKADVLVKLDDCTVKSGHSRVVNQSSWVDRKLLMWCVMHCKS